MDTVTYSDILAHKRISLELRKADLEKLKKWKAEKNERKFCGNAFLYHHQLENLLEVKILRHPLLREIMADDAKRQKMIADTEKRKRTGAPAGRIYEAYRVNCGSVVFFKASTAKYLYKKYGATSVLDFTAGWGGRMLGAWALGIGYTGVDTNLSLQPAYENMLDDLGRPSNIKMLWQSCLETDYSQIDYDFVLTSPPYVNLEVYPGMTPFESKAKFYKEFLIPTLNKVLTHIRREGRVALNISPQMYKDLLANGFRACDEQEDLLQQKRAGKDKGDKIYIWKSNPRGPPLSISER